MTEGVSLSGMIETPIVIHIGQRPGPATGLPTRTEQADLNLALYAGHGEFPRVIFAPGTHEEAFALSARAFDLADKYQIPVFILTDQYFIDSIRSLSASSLVADAPQAHIVETQPDYRRYVITGNGISPRGLPGHGAGLVGVDSDEHDEEAHITESKEVRAAMHEKRLRKMEGVRAEAVPPTPIGNVKKAKTLVVAWGSNRGVLEEAIEKAGNEELAGLHFAQVYPLPEESKKLFGRRKVVVLENNASGQFASLLAAEYGIQIHERVLKYNGDPFSIEEVLEKLKTL